MGAPRTRRSAALSHGETVALGATVAATVAAGVLHFAGTPGVPAFVAATIALAGLAWIVSFAPDEGGERFGPAVTGFLQSTLGNLPEFFIVIFALSAGETVVAQTSLIGSLFANAMLVLGIVIIVGARAGGGMMRFSPRLPRDTTTLLLLAVFTIVIVGLAVQSNAKAAGHVKEISIAGAISLLVVYTLWVFSYLRSDTPHEEAHRGEPRVPLRVSI